MKWRGRDAAAWSASAPAWSMDFPVSCISLNEEALALIRDPCASGGESGSKLDVTIEKRWIYGGRTFNRPVGEVTEERKMRCML